MKLWKHVQSLHWLWIEQILSNREYGRTLPSGQKIQVKSDKFGAHSGSGAYLDLSEKVLKSNGAADLLFVVFAYCETREVRDHVGPVSTCGKLSKKQKFRGL